MNKAHLLTLAALTFGVASMNAQAPAPVATTPAATWTVTPAMVSQYVFRGARLGGASFQPAVEYGSGPVAVGLWSNFPVSDKVPDVSDPEFDFYASYTHTVNSAFSVVPGFTWYIYPDAKKNLGYYKSTIEPSIAVNYTIGGVKLTPKLYYDLTLKGPTGEVTGAYTLPFKDIGSEITLLGTVGTFKWTDAANAASPKLKNWGNYWYLGATIPMEVTKNSKVILGGGYTRGTNNYYKQGSAPRSANPAAGGRPVFSVSYAMVF